MNKQAESGTIADKSLLNTVDAIGYEGAMTGRRFRGVARTIQAESGFDRANVEFQLAQYLKIGRSPTFLIFRTFEVVDLSHNVLNRGHLCSQETPNGATD